MRYSKQLLGGNIAIIMDSHDDEEIRQTFNSFFHHGAIGHNAELHWARETDGGGRAYFWVGSGRGSTSALTKRKIIDAYAKMKTYKFINKRLKVVESYIDDLHAYEDYVYEKIYPIMHVKAHKWFDSMDTYSRIQSVNICVGNPLFSSNWVTEYYDLGVVDSNVYEHESKAVKWGKHKRTMDRHIQGLQTI